MDDDTHDLVRRLFALLTAKLENGAAMAADGQRRGLAAAEQDAFAKRLHRTADEIATLAAAVVVLTRI